MSTTNLHFPVFNSTILQTGYGIPNHIGLIGSTYINLDNATEYINKDGFNLWIEKTIGGGSTFTGGTITGPTTFLNGLTTNTIILNGFDLETRINNMELLSIAMAVAL